MPTAQATLDHETQFIFRRYENGLKLAEIAKLHSVSRWHLCRRLRAAQPDYVRSLRRYSPERRKAFVLYCRLRSLRTAAKSYGLSCQALRNWFRAMHPNYAHIARSGAFAASADFLNSPKAQRHPLEANRVEAWLLENLPSLIASEGSSTIVSFAVGQERSLAKKETSRFADFRNTL